MQRLLVHEKETDYPSSINQLKRLVKGYSVYIRKSHGQIVYSHHHIMKLIAKLDRADKLLKEIEVTCNAIEDPLSKLYTMHQIILTFIVKGIKPNDILRIKWDSNSLKGRLIKFINRSLNNTLDATALMTYSKKLNDRLLVESDIENSADLLKRERNAFGIPEKGVSVKFFSHLSDLPLNKTIRDKLYSSWRLTAKDGLPVDIFGSTLRDGWYQYVIMLNNEIRFLPKSESSQTKKIDGEKYRSHAQLADGKPVYGAGNFKIENANIVVIDGGSGHYGTHARKHVLYTKLVMSFIGINTNYATLRSLENTPSSVSRSRFIVKTKAMLRGLIMSGEKAEQKPLPPPELRSRLPKY